MEEKKQAAVPNMRAHKKKVFFPPLCEKKFKKKILSTPCLSFRHKNRRNKRFMKSRGR